MKRKTSFFWVAVLAVLSVSSLIAQEPEPAAHAPSGDVRATVMSIYVPPPPHAPFTATVSTDWKYALADGTTISVENHRTIARDDSGRIFQERRNFYPAGDPRLSEIRQLEFSDPLTHEMYYCWPATEACQIYGYFAPAAVPPSIPPGPVGDGKTFLTRLDLGKDTVSGVETVGTRETTTINPGVVGNDRAISVVREFWYSERLGINVIEKRQDPTSGNLVFTVSPISLGEPDARLFVIPQNFDISDMRKPTQ